MKESRAGSGWWPLARSEEVAGGKPLAVRCGADEIVLFRGKDGRVCALEDRCPHRRIPLSMGRITPEGWLQCGYHGWCYDGATGACRKIPNLRPEERVPERYRAEPYIACEVSDLVYIRVGASAPTESVPGLLYDARGTKFSGTTMVALAHDEFVAALFDGPDLLLHMTGVRVLDQNLSDPVVNGDRLVLERGAAWSGPRFPDRFATEYPLILRTTAMLRTGEAVLEVLTAAQQPVMSALIAPVPVARGVTAVRWRSRAPRGARGPRAAAIRLLASIGVAPMRVRDHVDGARLSKLIAGPSHAWRKMLGRPPGVSAVASVETGFGR